MNFIDSFKRTFTFIIVVVIPLAVISMVLSESIVEEDSLALLKEQYSEEHIPSVDHSKLPELQKDFNSPHEVTAACLSCHTERGTEVMSNAHWNWEREAYIEGRGITYLGKRNLLNNFCTGILSNEEACNKCHIGYGWKDKTFDHSNPYNIDCLICHDKTGTYEKATGGAGYPPMGEEAPDYRNIVQHVGIPGKENCGYCHFLSAGGNNIKHGDLETALLDCDQNVDVHMGKDGLDMSCVDCHVTERHIMRGKYYAVSSTAENRARCEDCHGNFPHTNNKLNEHTVKVDCRTCHIPTYAKVNPTKMFWDWSTAGRRKDGLPYSVKDSLGNDIYLSTKGDFNWATNVKPEYVFFNGTADHHLITDIINTDTININTLFGSYRDRNSKIVPVKIHRGRQPYDLEYKTLIQAKLWAAEEGQGALWVDLDWEAALRKGMEYVGLPYSGHYGFIDTRMYLPISHMVSKSEDALKCEDCHTRQDGRLKGLADVYIPANSNNAAFDTLGIIILILSLIGVFSHALLRFVSWKIMQRKKQ
ncbi:MAG: tetrathionate reductase family octaheme c-type cytochrome [Bacteroidales bacterium]|nr:tetrathionate reductase family octaheme c-type cytochrome [Bacteroidales bacterium]